MGDDGTLEHCPCPELDPVVERIATAVKLTAAKKEKK